LLKPFGPKFRRDESMDMGGSMALVKSPLCSVFAGRNGCILLGTASGCME